MSDLECGIIIRNIVDRVLTSVRDASKPTTIADPPHDVSSTPECRRGRGILLQNRVRIDKIPGGLIRISMRLPPTLRRGEGGGERKSSILCKNLVFIIFFADFQKSLENVKIHGTF